jgi:hypothetical protein
MQKEVRTAAKTTSGFLLEILIASSRQSTTAFYNCIWILSRKYLEIIGISGKKICP